MLRRKLNILKNNSFFLFGARGTGKTSLINSIIDSNEALFIDLLDPELVEIFSLNPNELMRRAQSLPPHKKWIVLDEVQKVPALLDIVHSLIETKNLKFALSGSSARKLKRGGANLLAGRAYTYNLYPLTSGELGDEFNLEKTLSWGGLPKAHFIDDPEERKIFLQSYVHTYIKEEIAAEQIVRKLEPFRRFLAVAAQMNGKIINFSSVARDVGVSDATVRSYYEILSDTLMGFYLAPYHQSIRKRQVGHPKFYLFDLGVLRALSRTLDVPLKSQTYAFGAAFEHFVITEIMQESSYARNDFDFSYLRTKDDAEIDLIIDRPGRPTALIEIKSTNLVREHDVSTLKRFLPDIKNSEGFCLSLDKAEKNIDGVHCIHWKEGIGRILG